MTKLRLRMLALIIGLATACAHGDAMAQPGEVVPDSSTPAIAEDATSGGVMPQESGSAVNAEITPLP